ncbi:hypothetical protein ACFFIX_10950 [Metabacillus herbersteinensis]|uniref:Uncharacterized protein n=1 Tax=Metabacillus herbersteinensis TaxID=283816 RepID=A0ABV6GE59_9BACI
MKFKWIVFSIVGVILFFFLNVLSLMKLIPIYITSPLLFGAIFVTLYMINHRKTFKGF